MLKTEYIKYLSILANVAMGKAVFCVRRKASSYDIEEVFVEKLSIGDGNHFVRPKYHGITEGFEVDDAHLFPNQESAEILCNALTAILDSEKMAYDKAMKEMGSLFEQDTQNFHRRD